MFGLLLQKKRKQVFLNRVISFFCSESKLCFRKNLASCNEKIIIAVDSLLYFYWTKWFFVVMSLVANELLHKYEHCKIEI